MIEYSAKTHIGLKRAKNEDCYLVSMKTPKTFILCDGMGGHNGGAVASQTAAESIDTYIKMHAPFDLDEANAKKLIIDAADYANNVVYTRSVTNESLMGMGTTAEICIFYFDQLFIGHVGDSRVYLFRDGILRQLTTDHSLVEELISKGCLTEDEAEDFPNKNVITRAIGTEKTIDIDFASLDLLPDDYILMASDGLTGMVSDDEIKRILISDSNIDKITDALVERANQNGGKDNITVILVKKITKEEAL